jgi:hypothetical protein
MFSPGFLRGFWTGGSLCNPSLGSGWILTSVYSKAGYVVSIIEIITLEIVMRLR